MLKEIRTALANRFDRNINTLQADLHSSARIGVDSLLQEFYCSQQMVNVQIVIGLE